MGQEEFEGHVELVVRFVLDLAVHVEEGPTILLCLTGGCASTRFCIRFGDFASADGDGVVGGVTDGGVGKKRIWR